MKRTILVLTVLTILSSLRAEAQDRLKALYIQQVHVANNVGWAVPLGRTAEILSPRYSSSLGLDIALQNKRYFLYPFLDFLAFRYDQMEPDPDFAHTIENGRSNLYILNLAAGTRIRNDKWGAHAFVGPGLGLLTEPRAQVSDAQTQVSLKNKTNPALTLRGGVGADYKIGAFYIFSEISYVHYLRQMQARPVQALALYGGLKTNVTRIADKVVEIISEPRAN